jgi:RPA family protein
MSLWQSVITIVSALVGTLSGTVLGSVLKSRADTAGRVHEWQVSVVDIFGTLMAALSSHYAAMWDLEAARIRGDQDEIDVTLAASLVTRDAITRPRAQLVVLAPQLLPQINHAVMAVYAMDTAVQETGRITEQLTARRLAAKAAMEKLETATAAVMRRLGAGLPAANHLAWIHVPTGSAR